MQPSEAHSTKAKPSMLDAALALAASGWPVFPIWHVRDNGTCACDNPKRGQIGKHPRCTHGHRDATTDESQIRQWWAEPTPGNPDAWQCDPDSNIGIAIPEGIVIVDIDPRNGGIDTLGKVCAEHGGSWLDSLTVETGGAGLQVYFACEPGRRFPKNLDKHFGPGIDLKQCGGYVLAPPSNHKSGGTYEWQKGTDEIAPAPAWLTLLSKVHAASEDDAIAHDVPDAAELDDDLRARLDRAIELIEPEFNEGVRHDMAVAIGGYLHNRNLPALAARYVVSQLPSADPDARMVDAVWAYRPDVRNPPGASTLKGINPELLAALDALGLDEMWIRRFRARHAERAANEPAPEQRTELGNARRMVRMHGERLRCFLAYKQWYIWDGSRWAGDNTGEIERIAKGAVESLWAEAIEEPEHLRKLAIAWAAKSQDRSRISNMIALAATEPGIPVTAEMLDAHPWLLNVQNGTLDLRTGKLSDPDPALLMTKCCATHYDPDAQSDLWDAFVRRTTGGDSELEAYIQRALGYALVGAWFEKAFWFGHGPPDGAKSTMLGVVGKVMGDYHVSADPSTWMVQSNLGGNRGDLTRLLGARFVTSLEIRNGMKFDAALVKRVTGGDPITAAAKYKDEVEFPPTFALWMGANERPTIYDDDEGMWSRMRCVPFTNAVPIAEQDKALKDKLTSDAHAPAVLRWLVDGCKAWQHDGLGECAAVTKAVAAYRASMNQASGFAEEMITITGNLDDMVPCKVMAAAYERWCNENHVRSPLAPKALGQRLRSLGVQGGDDSTKRMVKGASRSIGPFANGRDRHWLGVKLSEE